jgi:predicted DNA-binding antitoxin AbrB/MazE fold protein
MNRITISAVYRKGRFKPKDKLSLPENTLVELQVTPLLLEEPSLKTLFGAFPELAVLSEGDMAWAKQLWEQSAEKQLHLLEEQGEQFLSRKTV